MHDEDGYTGKPSVMSPRSDKAFKDGTMDSLPVMGQIFSQCSDSPPTEPFTELPMHDEFVNLEEDVTLLEIDMGELSQPGGGQPKSQGVQRQSLRLRSRLAGMDAGINLLAQQDSDPLAPRCRKVEPCSSSSSTAPSCSSSEVWAKAKSFPSSSSSSSWPQPKAGPASASSACGPAPTDPSGAQEVSQDSCCGRQSYTGEDSYHSEDGGGDTDKCSWRPQMSEEVQHMSQTVPATETQYALDFTEPSIAHDLDMRVSNDVTLADIEYPELGSAAMHHPAMRGSGQYLCGSVASNRLAARQMRMRGAGADDLAAPAEGDTESESPRNRVLVPHRPPLRTLPYVARPNPYIRGEERDWGEHRDSTRVPSHIDSVQGNEQFGDSMDSGGADDGLGSFAEEAALEETRISWTSDPGGSQ